MLILRRRFGPGSWVRIRHKSGDQVWVMVDSREGNGDQLTMGFVDPAQDFEIVRKEVLDREADKSGSPRIHLP